MIFVVIIQAFLIKELLVGYKRFCNERYQGGETFGMARLSMWVKL